MILDKEINKIIQKRSRNEENRGKLAHHEASRVEERQVAAQERQKAPQTRLAIIEPAVNSRTSAPGAGRPRARGIYLINQVI